MNCVSCGKSFFSLTAADQCKACSTAEWKERKSINWFGMTGKQATAKDKEIEKKYTKFSKSNSEK